MQKLKCENNFKELLINKFNYTWLFHNIIWRHLILRESESHLLRSGGRNFMYYLWEGVQRIVKMFIPLSIFNQEVFGFWLG